MSDRLKEGDESRQGEVPGEESESQIREGDQGADGSNPAEAPEGEETVSEETSLVFTGDIYLSPYVLEQYDREGISGVLSEKLLSRNTARRGRRLAISLITVSGIFSSKQAIRSPSL